MLSNITNNNTNNSLPIHRPLKIISAHFKSIYQTSCLDLLQNLPTKDEQLCSCSSLISVAMEY